MKAIQKIICITLACIIVILLAPASYALAIHEFPQDFYLSQIVYASEPMPAHSMLL